MCGCTRYRGWHKPSHQTRVVRQSTAGLEFRKKLAKIAFNKFLLDRSIENRKKKIDRKDFGRGRKLCRQQRKSTITGWSNWLKKVNPVSRARSAIGSLPAAQWGVVVTLFGNSSLISFSMREGVKKGHQGSPPQRLAEVRRRWRQASTDVSHSTRTFSTFKLLCHVVTPTCHAGCRFAACELPFSVICIQLRGCRI